MSLAWRLRMADAASPGGGSRLAGLAKALARFVRARLGAFGARRRLSRELAQLDDRLLRDIGVCPADAGRVPRYPSGIAGILPMLTRWPEHF